METLFKWMIRNFQRVTVVKFLLILEYFTQDLTNPFSRRHQFTFTFLTKIQTRGLATNQNLIFVYVHGILRAEILFDSRRK